MNIQKSKNFKDILIIEPIVYKDDRGFFFESYNQKIEEELKVKFIQDNQSSSSKYVIRGLHYQWDKPVGKLCRCIRGALIDYVVDIRFGSPAYGKYESFLLTQENLKMIWIPPGFAHGFLSLEDDTNLLYKCTEYYNKNGEDSINPFDLDLSIHYPISEIESIMSEKDRLSQSFSTYNKDPKFIYEN